MALQLYRLEASPATRSVMMLCDIYNIPLKYIDVDYLEKEHLTKEFMKINPLHTIPVLVDGDLTLHDSHVILTYLTVKYGRDDSLYPKDVKQRALVDQQLYFDTLIFRRMRNITAPAIETGVRKPAEKLLKELQETYTFSEEFLSRTKYIASDSMSLADLCTVATISTIDKIIPLDAKKYPKTHAWLESMEKQPFYQKCNEPGLKQVKDLIQNVLDL